MRNFVLPLLTLGLAFPVLAGDGVLEINQTCAVNTGCFAGDTAGFPVTLSAEGSYRLTGNLDVSGQPTPENVTAIEITADGVTVDLDGFSIVGPRACPTTPQACAPAENGAGIGIDTLPGVRNTTVLGGTVRGMGSHGLSLEGRGTRVEGMRSLCNCAAGLVVGDDCTVRKTSCR